MEKKVTKVLELCPKMHSKTKTCIVCEKKICLFCNNRHCSCCEKWCCYDTCSRIIDTYQGVKFKEGLVFCEFCSHNCGLNVVQIIDGSTRLEYSCSRKKKDVFEEITKLESERKDLSTLNNGCCLL